MLIDLHLIALQLLLRLSDLFLKLRNLLFFEVKLVVVVAHLLTDNSALLLEMTYFFILMLEVPAINLDVVGLCVN